MNKTNTKDWKHEVLLLGGSGYLGGATTDILLSWITAPSFTVYDNLLYEHQFLKPVPFILGDVRDWDKVSKLIAAHDCIIVLSSIVGDQACSLNPELTISVNETFTKKLVKEFPNKRIIFMSSCSVYGSNNDGLLTENSPVDPLSLYAQTKLNSEKVIIENCKDFFVLRLGTLFGVGDCHSRIRSDLCVNRMSADALLNNELTIFGGDQWRPLIHVQNVGEMIAKLASAKEGQYKSGVYNLAMQNMIMRDLANEVAEVTGAKIKHVEIKFEDERNYRVSTQKAQNELEFIPKDCLSIKYGIRQIVDAVSTGRIKDMNDPYHSNAGFLKKEFHDHYKS